MWCVVTLMRVSLPMAGEGRAMMAMAAECAARAGCGVRMTSVSRMVSKPPQSHDHEAGCTERQAKRIRIHKVTACKILRLQGVQSVPEKVGVLYLLCKCMPPTATTQPSRHMVWYGERAVARLMACVSRLLS